MSVPAGAQIPLLLVEADAGVARRAEVWTETLRRLARLSDICVAAEAPARSVQIPIRGSTIALVLDGIIDFAAERVRLEKEIAKLDGEAAKIEAKLGNADFIRRAPDEVVEEQRERLAEAQSRRARLRTALSRLGV